MKQEKFIKDCLLCHEMCRFQHTTYVDKYLFLENLFLFPELFSCSYETGNEFYNVVFDVFEILSIWAVISMIL